MGKITSGLRPFALLFVLVWAGGAEAQIEVTTHLDSGTGSLRAAIEEANSSGSASQTITFSDTLTSNTIALDSPLPTIDVGTGTLSIDGTVDAGVVIVDGQSLHRVFFVESGTVSLADLAVNNGSAQGGDGGDGGTDSGGGGGGLGAGGGLFVNDGATVTLDGVGFDGNLALGGNGGSGDGGGAARAGGGGGGLLGDGGDGDSGGGGGGGFVDDPDSSGAEADGANGGATAGGKGGGMNDEVATGGNGGTVGDQPSPAFPFGGGGGAGPVVVDGVGGGDGGVFGGGGGGTGAGEGGDGGFGGGGGGSESGPAGAGGFGGGAGGTGTTGGGGGDGRGGAIFVREGGELVILSGSLNAVEANVMEGTGDGADGSASGAALYLMNGVDLSISNTDAYSIVGSISGDGRITKTGTGTLTLQSLDNDYSGGTIVQEGRVVGNGAESIQGAFVLASEDVTLEVVQGMASDGTLTAFISGAGSFTKSGAGKVILNPTGGTNSWTGGTQIGSGSLEASAGALPGAGAINVQTITEKLIVNEADGADETWSGDLLGGGEFVKTGLGTSRLTGMNTLTGSFAIEQGTLRANVDSLPKTIPVEIGDAKLVFDQASDATFGGMLDSVGTGAGELEKAGAGTLTLAGDNSQFDDDVTVSAGGLRITGTVGNVADISNTQVNAGSLILDGDGTLYSNATIAPGARLSGATTDVTRGLFGDLTMNGTLAPGNSIGTLHVNGNVTFATTARYEVEFDLGGSATDVDLLDVTGTAALAGPVAVSLLGIGGGGSRTILAADGEYGTSCFSDIENAPGFFTYELNCIEEATPDANEVILTVDFDDTARYADFVNTPNQTAVATALDPPPDPDVDDFSDPWNSARFELLKIPDQLPAVTDELGGEALTAYTTARLANAQEVGRVVSGRMRQVGGRRVGSAGTVDFLISGSRSEPGSRLAELGGAMLASNQADHALALAAAGPAFGAIAPGEGRRFGIWVDGYGVKGNLDGNANSSSTDWWSAGALIGFDAALGDHGILGLTGGWARLSADLDSRSLDDDVNVYQGGLYGAYVGERLYVGGLGRYAYSDFDTRRTLRFSGTTLDGAASAGFAGHEAGGFVELGYVAFAPAGWQIEPMLAGHFNWLSQEGFSERGTDAEIDALSLDVEKESWTSFVSALGLRINKQFLLERDLAIQPEIWGAWAHEYGDRDRPLNARFKGAGPGAARFRVLGATAARDGGQFGAGWSVSRNDMSFFFYYDGNANADLVAHGLTAGVLIRW